MANVVDYVKWRGDLSFDASPLCEVDNYILSKIGCPDYTGIIPSDTKSISIRDAVAKLFSAGNEQRLSLGPLASSTILSMLKLLPETVRFSSLRLSGFSKRLDFQRTEQFSALNVILPDGTNFITFRGTDDTIVGWKENFYMASMDEVPAQRDATEYLTWAAASYQGPIIVSGHSKGGNLAVYASANVPKSIQKRISCVYNNDGPGFQQSFLASEGYSNIKDRIITILPRHSIVGTLLTQANNPEVVQCDTAGIAAHDGFSWQVIGNHFVRCDSLSRASEVLDSALDDAIASMNLDERKEFIEDFFNILSSTGAVFLSDFSENTLQQALEIAKKLRGEKKVSKFLISVFQEMIKELFQNKKK